NPKTGEEVPITPRRVISFRASHVLKAHVNEALAAPARPAREPLARDAGAAAAE
ncbi:MAG: HU family DNA-binding protein, partial [Pseudomonadota bacterium]